MRACGVCHSDVLVQGGQFPGLALPRVPGHEVARGRRQDRRGVRPWQPGDRVGVGWHGGHCFVCDSCRVGDFVTCREEKITGIAYDGGYATHMLARAEALARIPDELGDAEAAPLLCAGITTFNGLPERGAAAPATSSRCRASAASATWPCSSRITWVPHGRDRARRGQGAARAQARCRRLRRCGEGLGGAALAKLGGAKAIVATAPSAAAVADVMPGLGIGGQLLLLAAVPSRCR
jgi:D-arabinose 1-dehydrogenase-like Zn-dependent alcohol dehydrogenase